MSPGPRRRMPTKAELRRMPGFQRKLNRFVGERRVAALAREIGVEASTLQRWLTGQSPTLAGIRSLAEGTGVPVAYWADDSVPPRDLAGPGAPQAEAPPVHVGEFAAERPGRRGAPARAEIALDADDPRALEVRGDTLLPLAREGEVVVFDAAGAGRARDGELVVVKLEGELTVRRRQTSGASRVYAGLGPEAAPVVVPLGDAEEEYPIVAVITRPRRRERAGVGEPEAGYAAEDAPSYPKSAGRAKRRRRR